MSNYWSIQCLDCTRTHDHPQNHGDEVKVEILSHRADWERIAEMVPQICRAAFVINGSEWNVFPRWFLKHKGHTLAVMSDYGYALNDCAEQYTCGGCDTQHTCKRKKGHEGYHNKVRDYDPAGDR